jgi:hypothetical protein
MPDFRIKGKGDGKEERNYKRICRKIKKEIDFRRRE